MRDLHIHIYICASCVQMHILDYLAIRCRPVRRTTRELGKSRLDKALYTCKTYMCTNVCVQYTVVFIYTYAELRVDDLG